MGNFRLERVENSVRDVIASLLVSGKIKDYRVSKFVTITRVKISPDLSFAKIGVSSFEGQNITKKSVEGLNSASGFIQKEIGKKLKTRNTPKLYFVVDTSLEDGFNMINKLNHLND